MENGKSRSYLIVIIALVIVVAVVTTVIILVLNHSKSIKNDLEGNRYKEGNEVSIEIPEGAYLAKIADLLYENGVIKYSKEFIKFAKTEGSSDSYKFGVHTINTNMSYSKIDEELQKTAPLAGTVKATIPEGYELRQIVDLLVEKGLGTKQGYTSAIKTHDFKYDFLKDIPKSEVRLEGYLFPATYSFNKDDTEIEILDTMLKKFNQVFTNEYKERASDLKMSIQEVITLASIVEREAANDTERDIVASVFYNRLKSPTYPYLESCATVQYILKERKAVLSIADTRIDSPYNTYINKGLPPAPIASPGLESIKATLYPATSDYYFFVLGNNGKHVFSKTYDEHLQHKNELNQ